MSRRNRGGSDKALAADSDLSLHRQTPIGVPER